MAASTQNFAKQISLEEYNKQKKDYTEKALLELKAQIAEFKLPAQVNDNTGDDVDNDSDNDSGDNSGDNAGETAKVNVIIKNYKDSSNSGDTGLRKRRIPSKSKDNNANELYNTIYAQRELDLQEIKKLTNQIKQLKNALAEEERKNHFLKLDLCNSQVDNSDLKQAMNLRDNSIIQLKDKESEYYWQIIKLKMFIGLLVMLYIYAFIF